MRGDWNLLKKFCDEYGVGIQLNYLEACGELELRVVSAAPAEEFYMKRVSSIEYFIQCWRDHVFEQQKKALKK